MTTDRLSSATKGVKTSFVAAPKYALSLLFLSYVVNYIDRQTVIILQEPVKADLALSDTQLGLLTGLAFALFYAVMGVPIARLADRYSRRNIITTSMTLWSMVTMASGAAVNFWRFLAARIGVGIGEAGVSPPAHSLISDHYPPEKRGAALGLYSSGIQFGVMLGFLLGGLIHYWFGWRTAFFVAGIPGLLLALLVHFTLQEPPSGQFDADLKPETRSFWSVLTQLWSLRAFRYVALACGFHSIVLYGHGQWSPPYLGRVHEMQLNEIAYWLALIAVGPGVLGLWLGGVLADRLQSRFSRAKLWVAIASVIIILPLECVYALAPSATSALILSAIIHLFSGTYLAPVIAFSNMIVDPYLRASASAVLLLGLNLIGLGLGPLIVGKASDMFVGSMGDDSLRYAMLIIIPFQLVALIFFSMSAHHSKANL